MHYELNFTNVYFLFSKLCKVLQNKNIKVVFASDFIVLHASQVISIMNSSWTRESSLSGYVE